MIHVFMDDMRRCPAGFTLARSGEECLELLRKCEVDILSLDHDMGPGEMTGTDVVALMVTERLYPRQVYLHTSSLMGKTKMYNMLYEHKPEYVVLHNGPMPHTVLTQIAEGEVR